MNLTKFINFNNHLKNGTLGKIMDLLKEAELNQRELRITNKPSRVADISKTFTHDMRKGTSIMR